ncbi:MAG: ATP-grasp domain-containing protein [Deltaproteobacteria bacterium]|nr:ATP-grasp domain-containing protein [Deltaproteobacteria bacterium]
MFSKILIANRGIIRTNCVQVARELGAVAAVMSLPGDDFGLGERTADEIYVLDTKDPAHAYYDREAIAELAVDIYADAIHPGYGFLAQDALFATELRDRGITLIASGLLDDQHSITDKTKVKQIAAELDIPTLKGSSECATFTEVEEAAAGIGCPLIIKPLNASGGLGLNVCFEQSKLQRTYDNIKLRLDTAAAACKTVFIESFLPQARHIELPVLRDSFGNIVSLPPLEGSIQRRFRKLIIESPAAFSDDKLIQQMTVHSCRLVEHLGLVGCLSVEFLYDGNDIYFNEINGYIQPTHLVTHAHTGVNLLAQQIKIFAGEKLDITQADINPRGHALGVSINAEDPENNFIPSTGALNQRFMYSGMGVTVHKTFVEGEKLSSFYEPVLAQLIAVDQTRTQTINKLITVLRSYILEGVKTNIAFIEAILNSALFRAGKMDSSYIHQPKALKELITVNVDEKEEDIAALLAALTLANDAQTKNSLLQSHSGSLWGKVKQIFNYANR